MRSRAEPPSFCPPPSSSRCLSPTVRSPISTTSGTALDTPRGPSRGNFSGNVSLLFNATLVATDIVIASLAYWYSLSSRTKRYLDHWMNWMNIPGLGLRAAMAKHSVGRHHFSERPALARRIAGQHQSTTGPPP
ncbi:hypothetical protein QFZ66_002165 [Streptomyces sp. B4I13]|nr:hypothetical protein [Streptomyces sp. B4I13]